MRITRAKIVACVICWAVLAACGGQKQPAVELVGSASAALSQVPNDVSCIRITVSGLRTVVRTFDVTTGTQPVVLNLTGLPVGQDTFAGEGFSGACSTITNTSVPSWITDPIQAAVAVATPAALTLIFRPNGRAGVCADFESDTSTLALLTSITLDPEDATGTTTNAPGAWTTNTGDSLGQILVISNGKYLNSGANLGQIGEISVPLNPGINSVTLLGTTVAPSNAYYGCVLFFDGVATPPQVAVFNSNGGTGAFSVQPKDTQIMGGANGGLFFDKAPGTSVYTATNGTQVEVLGFTINSSSSSTTDLIGFATIAPDVAMDTVATLTLNVKPPCP